MLALTRTHLPELGTGGEDKEQLIKLGHLPAVAAAHRERAHTGLARVLLLDVGEEADANLLQELVHRVDGVVISGDAARGARASDTAPTVGPAAWGDGLVARRRAAAAGGRGGAAARAGLGSDDLRVKNPRLITVDISGYGEEGPYADMKAYDLLVQAEAGLSSVTGRPEGPGRVGVSACDISCGMYSYMAVLEALIERDQTGEGGAIRTSLFEGMADWMNVPLLTYDYAQKIPQRVGLNHPSIAPYGAYPTQDGGEILISIQNEREFVRLAGDVLERPDMPTDEKFCSNEARCANRPALDEIITDVFTSIERTALTQRLRGAQIAFGEINDVAGLSAHPALRRVEVDSPTGPVALAAPPATVNGEVRELGPVPGIGDHTDKIRKEFS